MTPLEILTRAREIITPPGNWTRHYVARNKDGEVTFSSSPDACQWCAIGAIEAASGSQIIPYPPRDIKVEMDSALNTLRSAIPAGFSDPRNGGPIVSIYNDAKSTSHDDILKLFDRAISAAKKDEDA